MFLIDKYTIQNPWDVEYNNDIFKRVLNLQSLNSWSNDTLDEKDIFNDMPNLLIHGSCGKKSLINLLFKRIYGENLKTKNVSYTIKGYGSNNQEIQIIQSLYHIEIKPTGTGLDKYIVQEVIKDYGCKRVLSLERKKRFKIIWISNMEDLSYYAQTALRCTMEKYADTCRFILSCKQLTKILEPIKSRCLMIRLPSPSDSDIMKLLMTISVKENKFLKIEEYDEIIVNSNSNIKLALINLEKKYYGIVLKESWKEFLSEIIVIMKKTLKSTIQQNHVSRIRHILYKIFITNINGTIIMKELLIQILTEFSSYNKQYEIVNLCTKFENSLANGKRSIIHLEAFIYSIFDLLNEK